MSGQRTWSLAALLLLFLPWTTAQAGGFYGRPGGPYYRPYYRPYYYRPYAVGIYLGPAPVYVAPVLPPTPAP